MEEKRDPSVLLKKFMEWTKPKSNALAAASNFRGLEQGDLSLAQYIDKATILCNQSEYPPEALYAPKRPITNALKKVQN